MNNLKLLLLAGILLISSAILAQDPNFQIYLCFGQSNMAGRGEIEEQDKTVDSRFRMMSTVENKDRGRTIGKWYAAEPPLCRSQSGLSPADYFGRNMIKRLPEKVKVGVICVAIGGCDIRLFNEDIYENYISKDGKQWFTDIINDYGGNPYQRLICLAKLAQKDGVIKGILLHQGETNTGDEEWPEYVKTVYNNMLKDLSLKAEDVPLLAGEVANADQNGKCARANIIIDKLHEVVPTAYVISSKGCTLRDDFVHFNSAGVREIGQRYAQKMLEVQGYKKLVQKIAPNTIK